MNTARRFQRLSADDATTWLAAHPEALRLDAREAQHHAQGHLDGSLRLDGRNHETLLLREAKTRPVFIYCYHGNASQTYAQMFVDFGFAQVADLIGGWRAWQKRGVSLDAHGNTPLMLAARYGTEDSVELLLLKGADRALRNDRQFNAADYARLDGREALARRLESDKR